MAVVAVVDYTEKGLPKTSRGEFAFENFML